MALSTPHAVVVTDAERRLKTVLRVVAGVVLVLTLAALIGTVSDTLRQPPWIGAAATAGALAALTAVYAAGEPARRAGLTWILVAMLAAAAATQVAYAIAGKGDTALLIVVAAAQAALAAAVALAARAAQRRANHDRGHWPTEASAGLKPVLLVLAAASAAAAVASVLLPFTDDWQPLLCAESAAACLGIAGLSLYAVADLRDRLPLVAVPAVALVVGSLTYVVLALPTTDLGQTVVAFGVGMSALAWLLIGICAPLLVAALLLLLRRAAARARLQPKFLGATEYRTLMALADVIIQGPEEAVPPPDIARNVDTYFSNIRATRRWVQRAGLVAMQLHPLLSLKAPFSELDEESRRDHLDTHFVGAVRGRRGPEPLRRFIAAIMRVANQLAYVGYYSDKRSFPTIGYDVFENRGRYKVLDAAGKIPHPGPHPLQVTKGEDVDGTEVEAEVCIVGSGAAGALLAYRLAEAGKSVVVLERGQYVEPRDMNSDEVDMIGRLYGDGVFQQTEDFRFTVLQGSCVGGSTVVNNAVSIPTPEHVLHRWNSELGAGLDLDAYAASTERVKQFLRIRGQGDGVQLNPSAPKFLEGAARHGDSRLAVSVVNANIDGCLGCGYCNIGCRFGHKLSMLETALPWAQERFGADKVRIYADCEARKIVAADGRARAVKAKLPDGRTLTVKAEKVVVSAGTIASSYLLLRSGIGKDLPVGRHVCFNMGAPLTAEFDDDLDAFDGLQISHVAVPPSERGWVFETWWNPPVSQALNMPGWFEVHYENMRRYRKLMAVGALVGTERNAWIGRALTGGPAVNYVPTSGDMRKLADGLTELGQILFEGGAKALMLNGWDFYRFTSPAALAELPSILSDPSMVTLGTGHPQGGNALGDVVDRHFRLRGYENLYVCDASVFPSSLTVNPQLTVMSLADYAAPSIANGHP